MGIQNVTKNQIKDVASFVWRAMSNVENVTYTIFSSEEEIRQNFHSYLEKQNSYLLSYIDDGEMLGVLAFYTIPKDKYLQTTAVYTLNQNKNIATEFFHNLEQALIIS